MYLVKINSLYIYRVRNLYQSLSENQVVKHKSKFERTFFIL